ncbi:MAG TPA: hypothetical protein VI408_13720 [Gaiellaceae bacterium]
MTVVAFFALAPSAFAGGGSPRDICNDLQDGKLDGSYTPAQIAAFQNDATMQGYCGSIAQAAAPAALGVRGTTHPRSGVSPIVATTRRSSTLPFTGTDLGVFALLGMALVGMGLLLRRGDARE